MKLEFNVILSELWLKDSRKVDTESLEFGVTNFVVGQVRRNEKRTEMQILKEKSFVFNASFRKFTCLVLYGHIKLKWSRYRPGVAQRVGRGIALLFHDRGTRRWVSGQQHAPAALYPLERLGTHCTKGWVGPRAGLDGGKNSSPPGFDPGPSSP